jgi:hypothetical protein
MWKGAAVTSFEALPGQSHEGTEENHKRYSAAILKPDTSHGMTTDCPVVQETMLCHLLIARCCVARNNIIMHGRNMSRAGPFTCAVDEQRLLHCNYLYKTEVLGETVAASNINQLLLKEHDRTSAM